LRELIKTALNIEVSKELIRIVIKRCNFSSKKARFYGEPKDLEMKTKQFIEARDLLLQGKHPFVSIDETSFGRSGPIVKGYSKVGTRLFVRKRVPRMTTISSIACVSPDGLVAKSNVTGCFNTERFLEFLKDLNLIIGTVILLDNVRFHHSKVVKEYASLKGWILLFVPPYSPWYNPIEFCFSIIKRDFYKYQDFEKAYKCLTPSHCSSFFKKSLNCSYLKI
jgi:transposase